MKKTRTNVVLDDDLIAEIMKLSEEKTKREVIENALHERLRILKRKKLAALRGKVKWEGDLDQMRRGRF
ncbi:MAG: type II toxin-antitoxin system VapB family antitoxin [Cyclobacteriaceae bacterium]|nr:MAG: type II toxin-antitoxin system VapB family antitoxin [Cyclobacteriaceae bacterium]